MTLLGYCSVASPNEAIGSGTFTKATAEAIGRGEVTKTVVKLLLTRLKDYCLGDG